MLCFAAPSFAGPDLVVELCEFSPATAGTTERILISVRMRNIGSFSEDGATFPDGSLFMKVVDDQSRSIYISRAPRDWLVPHDDVVTGGQYVFEPGDLESKELASPSRDLFVSRAR